MLMHSKFKITLIQMMNERYVVRVNMNVHGLQRASYAHPIPYMRLIFGKAEIVEDADTLTCKFS